MPNYFEHVALEIENFVPMYIGNIVFDYFTFKLTKISDFINKYDINNNRRKMLKNSIIHPIQSMYIECNDPRKCFYHYHSDCEIYSDKKIIKNFEYILDSWSQKEDGVKKYTFILTFDNMFGVLFCTESYYCTESFWTMPESYILYYSTSLESLYLYTKLYDSVRLSNIKIYDDNNYGYCSIPYKLLGKHLKFKKTFFDPYFKDVTLPNTKISDEDIFDRIYYLDRDYYIASVNRKIISHKSSSAIRDCVWYAKYSDSYKMVDGPFPSLKTAIYATIGIDAFKIFQCDRFTGGDEIRWTVV